MSLKPVHIVCLRFSSLGDVLLQSSMFSMLKSQYGDNLKLTLMTAEEFAPLLKDHPHIDNVLSFSRKMSLAQIFKTFSEYHQNQKVDFIFDLHNTIRANLLKLRFWKIPKIAVDKRKLERKIFTSPLKLKMLESESIMERVIKDFNFLWPHKYDKESLSRFIFPDTAVKALSSLPASFDRESSLATLDKFQLKVGEYIAIIPSASHETKRWSQERYKELAISLSSRKKIVVLAGPEDDFCQIFNGHDDVINLQGKTTFQESSDIVGNAKLCIGNDTGLIHMAEAQLVNCLMIMGPTSEAFGFSTHLKDSYTFSHKLWCRPCSATGARKCFRDQAYCLNLTQVDDVIEKALARIE